MKNHKLIFSDVDGTVLSSDGRVTKENCEIMKRALKEGNRIAITTGRSVRGVWPVIRALGLECPGVYLAAYQGAVIFDCGQKKVLAEEGIPGEDAAELLRELQQAGIYAHTFTGNGILTPGECEELVTYCELTPEKYRVTEDFSELCGKTVPKVIAMDFKSDKKLLAFRKNFQKKERGRFDSFFSSICYLEYCRKGCNKGSALRKLAELLQWPLEDTIAVGDERNDIPMIRAAGIGAAMRNGHEEAKAAADYVTQKDCNHSGVAEVIRKFAPI